MAVKQFYFLNTTAVTPNWFGVMQDGGSAPAAANSAFGFTVGKVAVTTPFWRARLGATSNAQTSSGTSHIASTTGPTPGTGSGNSTAGDSFISPAVYTGVFAAGNWVFNFNVRAGTVTPVGRMRAQVWASANANGSSARKLTSTVLVGSTVTMSTTTTTYNSTVTWNAPQVTLTNEYLFIQVEWEETTAGTANGTAVQFYQSAAAFTTTDFAPTITSTGDLDPINAVVAGVGVSSSTGTGDLDPTEADIVGLGTSGSVEVNDPDTVLLQHYDGSFADDSDYNHPFFATGGITTSNAQSKFGGSSLYLGNAAGPHIEAPDAPELRFQGDFTVDFWIWLTTNPAATTEFIAKIGPVVNFYGPIYIEANSLGGVDVYMSSNGTSWDIMTSLYSGTFSNNAWHHIAFVRSGNTFTIYRDGTSAATTTSSLQPVQSIDPLVIGAQFAAIDGYVEELRISKVARWTSNFTPPTQAYSLVTNFTAGSATLSGSGTVVTQTNSTGDLDAASSVVSGIGTSASVGTSNLVVGTSGVAGVGVSLSSFTGSLVGGAAGVVGVGTSASSSSGAFVVGSSSLAGSGTVGFVGIDATGVLNAGGSTLTGSGTVSWPVITGSGAFGANTPLPNFLLHGESFVDSAGGHTVNAGGSTISSAQKKFGGNSFLIGAAQAVTLDAAADMSIGSADDFTIDLWTYPTSTASVHPFAAWNAGSTDNLVACIRGGGCLQIFDHGGLIVVGSTPFTLNGWNHVAVTRSGGSLRGFLNGVQQGSANNGNTQTYPLSGNAPKFGNASVGGTQQFVGHLDEIRFIKGQAVWTSNFTPPSVPYDLGTPALVAGVGTTGSVGTGTLVAGSSVVSGTATSRYISTGTLADATATVVGVGSSASTSTGSLVVGACALSGTANAVWNIQGTLVSQSSVVAGSGTARSIGTGSLVANAATIVGTSGPVVINATGNLVAGAVSLTSTVTVSSRGTGALVVSPSVLSGSATATYYGTGTLQAGLVTVSGSAFSGVAGTANLNPASSTLAGSVTATWYTTGILQAGVSSLTGSARVTSTGTGQLAANNSTIGTGLGSVHWHATGNLVADRATVAGIAIAGATFGDGELVAGSAVLSGNGGIAPAIGVSYPRLIIVPDTSTIVSIAGSNRTVVANESLGRTVSAGNGGRTIVVNNGTNRKLVA